MPQNLVISPKSNENSFDRDYEISSADKTSESYLNGLSSIIKKAQQETNHPVDFWCTVRKSCNDSY